jgi:flagellar basal body-associated protein FliL
MQNEQQQKRAMIAKRVIIVVVILVAIFAVGMGVALLLRNVSQLADTGSPSTNNQPDNTPATSTAPSAASLISGYIQPENVRVFAENYQLQQDATAPARISYTAEGEKYEVSLSTSSYAMFYATGKVAASDATTVSSQTDTYLTGQGFKKTATNAKNSTVTYSDQGSVCQLTSMPSSQPAYYLMACADKTDVDKEYATIEKLLSIYKKTNQLGSFTRAITSTISSDNKTMTTISLTTNPNTHPVLLFAAVDNDWAYIGNVGGGNAMTSNGKYSLSAQVEAAIHQAKYGDFLVHNLQ